MTNLLATDNITVLGGPSTISVDLDFGPTGQRGSYWIVGNGNPNSPSTQIGQTPLIQDMYLDVDPSDEEYLSVYQYQNQTGTNTWVKLFNLIPSIRSKNILTTFAAGESTIDLPLIDIVPQENIGTVTVNSFNVQHSIVNTGFPVASGLSIIDIVTDNNIQVLRLQVSAQYFEGTWKNLSGEKTVHLFISMV
jgi:hypothetical protein